jgi:hypothetical protein
MLPPATAGSLKAFVQLARSQAARKTLLKQKTRTYELATQRTQGLRREMSPQ